jgi:hypothetical protein
MTLSGRLPAFIRSASVFLAAFGFSLIAAGEQAIRLSTREFLGRASEIGSRQTVELEGTVTAIWGDEAFFIQDGDAGVFVLREGASFELQRNDRIVLTGRFVPIGDVPTFAAEFIRHTTQTPGNVPTPQHLDAKAPPTLALHGKLVEIMGTVESSRLVNPDREIAINVAGISTLVFFGAIEEGSSWPAVKVGRPGRGNGVLAARESRDRSPFEFRILVGSRRDLSVIDSKPWWWTSTSRAAAGSCGRLGACRDCLGCCAPAPC